ncbi:hypothetical protein [Jeotgalibacillus terrae]|uniref:Uncharacterized protein n=1 Tax=Jeotgalibacillus terrae TaxID=587735 RepID=A0ABW5ZDW5_9BACL|nr:hypothetical protein [Jeotgalibacillus terrae]MBM7579020.1 hypothetical protein [Jeotgalibacillus terrae]
MTLQSILQEFHTLKAEIIPVDLLDERYADLMIRMEQSYKIPDVITEEWEQKNRSVSTVYRLIASNRLMDT